MLFSSFSSRAAFDAPIRFPDGREYRVGDWTLAANGRAPRDVRRGEMAGEGLFVEVEVTRIDRPHPGSRYPTWGDTFLFVLHFPELRDGDEEARNKVLAFTRLWVCRHLRENGQPRAKSRHVVTIEGSFGE